MINLAAIDSFGWAVLGVLGVLLPLLGVGEFGLLSRWVLRGRRNVRLRFYGWIMGLEWVLTLSLLAWWVALGRSAGQLGLLPRVTEPWQWLGVMAGLTLTFLAIMQMNMILGDDRHLTKVRESLGKLFYLAPRTPRERGAFIQVSVTAGICEEILYRGFLMYALTPAVGGLAAFFVVAAVFGLGHTYQGWDGMGKNAMVGLVFGAMAFASGSLVVGMVLHTVLDMTSGRLMEAAVAQEARARWEAVQGPGGNG